MEIQTLPDDLDGIKCTFPHQSAVGETERQKPWRAGHPCLGESTDAWGDRYGYKREPTVLYERLIWHIERFSGWCIRAARGALHNAGEPFELPPLPAGSTGNIVGFNEAEQNFTFG